MEGEYYITEPVYKAKYLAEEALDELRDIFDTYGYITVNDIYDVHMMKTGAFIQHDETEHAKWIHQNIQEAAVKPLGDGYAIGFKTLFCMDPEQNRVKPEPEPKPDMVNHPKHYKSEAGLEVIDVIEAFTADLTGIQATDTGNIIKYICRWKSKNGVEDLEKAKWYLEHLISKVKNNSTKESN